MFWWFRNNGYVKTVEIVQADKCLSNAWASTVWSCTMKHMRKHGTFSGVRAYYTNMFQLPNIYKPPVFSNLARFIHFGFRVIHLHSMKVFNLLFIGVFSSFERFWRQMYGDGVLPQTFAFVYKDGRYNSYVWK